MRKFICSICGYIYDESAGIPEKGILSGTTWENLSDIFVCPVCGAPKPVFKPYEEKPEAPSSVNTSPVKANSEYIEPLEELSLGEISAICSSLAKGCEKQRLTVEMEAFNKLSD